VEQLVARRAHNPKVAGSNPAPATTGLATLWVAGFFIARISPLLPGALTQQFGSLLLELVNMITIGFGIIGVNSPKQPYVFTLSSHFGVAVNPNDM
jgi:cyanate permease